MANGEERFALISFTGSERRRAGTIVVPQSKLQEFISSSKREGFGEIRTVTTASKSRFESGLSPRTSFGLGQAEFGTRATAKFRPNFEGDKITGFKNTQTGQQLSIAQAELQLQDRGSIKERRQILSDAILGTTTETQTPTPTPTPTPKDEGGIKFSSRLSSSFPFIKLEGTTERQRRIESRGDDLRDVLFERVSKNQEKDIGKVQETIAPISPVREESFAGLQESGFPISELRKEQSEVKRLQEENIKRREAGIPEENLNLKNIPFETAGTITAFSSPIVAIADLPFTAVKFGLDPTRTTKEIGTDFLEGVTVVDETGQRSFSPRGAGLTAIGLTTTFVAGGLFLKGGRGFVRDFSKTSKVKTSEPPPLLIKEEFTQQPKGVSERLFDVSTTSGDLSGLQRVSKIKSFGTTKEGFIFDIGGGAEASFKTPKNFELTMRDILIKSPERELVQTQLVGIVDDVPTRVTQKGVVPSGETGIHITTVEQIIKGKSVVTQSAGELGKPTLLGDVALPSSRQILEFPDLIIQRKIGGGDFALLEFEGTTKLGDAPSTRVISKGLFKGISETDDFFVKTVEAQPLSDLPLFEGVATKGISEVTPLKRLIEDPSLFGTEFQKLTKVKKLKLTQKIPLDFVLKEEPPRFVKEPSAKIKLKEGEGFVGGKLIDVDFAQKSSPFPKTNLDKKVRFDKLFAGDDPPKVEVHSGESNIPPLPSQAVSQFQQPPPTQQIIVPRLQPAFTFPDLTKPQSPITFRPAPFLSKQQSIQSAGQFQIPKPKQFQFEFQPFPIETLGGKQRQPLRLQQRVSSRLVQSERLVLSQRQSSFIRQQPIERIITGQRLVQRQSLRLQEQQRTTGDSIQNFRFFRPSVTPPFFFPPIIPRLLGGGGTRRRRGKKRRKRDLFFVPSIAGIQTGLTIPKAPKGFLTGIETRGVVTRKR